MVIEPQNIHTSHFVSITSDEVEPRNVECHNKEKDEASLKQFEKWVQFVYAMVTGIREIN